MCIDTIMQDGGTNTSGAIWAMKEVMFAANNGDRISAPNVGIVITAGPSTVDADKTAQFAQEARAAGIRLFSIGIGNVCLYRKLLLNRTCS